MLSSITKGSLQHSLYSLDAPHLRYVIKLHHASSLHFDFRLEIYGSLFSLVTRKPLSLVPQRSIWAKRVGDHNPKWLLVERRIPDGHYGAGPMVVWDHGVYVPRLDRSDSHEANVLAGLTHGTLDFKLVGQRLNGLFCLSRDGGDWNIRKLDDQFALRRDPQWDYLSVLTGRSLMEMEVDASARTVKKSAIDTTGTLFELP